MHLPLNTIWTARRSKQGYRRSRGECPRNRGVPVAAEAAVATAMITGAGMTGSSSSTRTEAIRVTHKCSSVGPPIRRRSWGTRVSRCSSNPGRVALLRWTISTVACEGTRDLPIIILARGGGPRTSPVEALLEEQFLKIGMTRNGRSESATSNSDSCCCTILPSALMKMGGVL